MEETHISWACRRGSAGGGGGAYGHSPGYIPPSNQELRHGQSGGCRANQHLSASRLNAPQPPPPSPALVRHGSKQRHERRHASGPRGDRDPRRQSNGQHLSQPSTPGTSANQLPSQGQIRMSQTPLQQSQLPGGATDTWVFRAKEKGIFGIFDELLWWLYLPPSFCFLTL